MPRLHGMVPVEEQDSCLDHLVWFCGGAGFMPRPHGMIPLEEQDSCPDYMVWFLWRSRLMPKMVPAEVQVHALTT